MECPLQAFVLWCHVIVFYSKIRAYFGSTSTPTIMNSPQFTAEQNKCLYCENPECQIGCPAGCSPRDFLKAAQLQSP